MKDLPEAQRAKFVKELEQKTAKESGEAHAGAVDTSYIR